MTGLGTIVNTAAVVCGGLIGLTLKNGIRQKMQDIMMQACGVATVFIGAAGVLSKMLVVQDGGFKTQGTMLLIFSLVLGGLLGEWLDIEQKMDLIGEKIKKAVKAENDNLFVEGFVNVSLIICVGAMAIVGSIQDGISGDSSLLITKAILDFIIVVVFAATYGIGAVFSAVPIFVYQGAITLAAALLGNFVSDAVVSDLSFIGSALIFCVGINIAFGTNAAALPESACLKKFRVGNMLPALIIPILYHLLPL